MNTRFEEAFLLLFWILIMRTTALSVTLGSNPDAVNDVLNISEYRRVSFTCMVHYFDGQIVNPRLIFTSEFHNIISNVDLTWNIPLYTGSYALKKILRRFDGSVVACLVTDSVGRNYSSDTIHILVQVGENTSTTEDGQVPDVTSVTSLASTVISSTMGFLKSLITASEEEPRLEYTTGTNNTGGGDSNRIVVIAVPVVVGAVAVAAAIVVMILCFHRRTRATLYRTFRKRKFKKFKLVTTPVRTHEVNDPDDSDDKKVFVPRITQEQGFKEDGQADAEGEKFVVGEQAKQEGTTATVVSKRELPRVPPSRKTGRDIPAELGVAPSTLADLEDSGKGSLDKAAEGSGEGDEFEDICDNDQASGLQSQKKRNTDMESGFPVIAERQKQLTNTPPIPGAGVDKMVCVVTPRFLPCVDTREPEPTPEFTELTGLPADSGESGYNLSKL